MTGLELGGMSAIGGGVLSGIGNLFSSMSQADAMKAAMEKYLAYVNQMRQTFLDQPETQNARPIFQAMLKGDYGFSPESLAAMRGGVAQDYGYGLRDSQRMAAQSGIQPGGAYTPGNRSRATRLMSENLAVRKAESNRAITTANENQRQSNFRFASQAAPTYMPGMPATQMVGPDVFKGMEAPNAISIPGSLMQAGGAGASGYGQFQSPLNQYFASLMASQGGSGGSAVPNWGPIGQSVFGGLQNQSMAPSQAPYEAWRNRGGYQGNQL